MKVTASKLSARSHLKISIFRPKVLNSHLGIGEGVAFRGRLVIACHVELLEMFSKKYKFLKIVNIIRDT